MDGEELKKPRANILVGSHRVTKAPIQEKKLNTFQQPPLAVFLELSFKDPEGKTKLLPIDLEVEIVFGNNQKKVAEKIKKKPGLLRFPLTRKNAEEYKFFRLHFETKDLILCEKSGDDKNPVVLDTASEADKRAKDGFKFFSLPAKWSLLSSDWKVSADEHIYDNAEKEKKFLLTENDEPRNIGTIENPVKLELEPHWQYVKYEFFDRYYGHSNHKDKPISIPPITVEGMVKNAPETPITRSNWTILPNRDEKEIIQCLPWILQAKEDGTAETKPDKDSLLQFKHPKDTFIVPKSATERTLKQGPYNSLPPSIKSLRVYDLPELWKSQNYWSRLSDNKDEQGFFEKMVEKKTTKEKPLIFSLDDIVLTDDKLVPISMRDTDKVVLFYHEFLDPVSDRKKKGTGGRAGAKYYKNGLYKPGLNLVEAKAAAEKTAENAELGKMDEEYASGEYIDGVRDERINAAREDAAKLADAPLQARIKAEAKQKTIEENTAKEKGEEKARKIIETLKSLAERRAKAEGKSDDEAKRAGEDRIKDIGKKTKEYQEQEIKALETDKAAQKRITDAGKEAEDAATVFPYSDVLRHETVPNYITDYPYWTRLVVANGNLYNNFDKRTNSGDVIGARAAVRLVDATIPPVGVKSQTIDIRDMKLPNVKPAAAQQDNSYFILQPYYRQNFMEHSFYHNSTDFFLDDSQYDEWNNPLPSHKFSIGRSELGLLRVSNYSDTMDEEAVVFVYHRANFDFTGKSEFGLQLPDNHKNVEHPLFSVPIRNNEKREKYRYQWIENFLKNCANRWNGNDDVNRERAWIQEKKDANPKFRAQVVTFLQYQPADKAHFKIAVEDDGQGYLNSRGGGSFDTRDGRDTKIEGAFFGGAHEYGHAGGQPEDYTLLNYGQLAFGSFNVPGAPFSLDEYAMMKTNNQVRARSFWHITEWLRGLKPFSERKFQVFHNGFKYEVPHYNHIDRFPGRNYTHWAVKGKTFHDDPAPVYYDSFLYFLGSDEFSKAQENADGIMVIMIKTKVEFTGYTTEKVWKEFILKQLNEKVAAALNKPRVYAQFNLDGVDRGGQPTFKKCLLHFSPRFDVDKSSDNQAHLKVIIKTPDPGDPIQIWARYFFRDKLIVAMNYTESQIHGKLNDKTLKDNTKIIRRESGTDVWSNPQEAKDWGEYEANFEEFSLPRELAFRFPPKPVSNDDSDQLDQFVLPRFQNVFFKHICQMLGLSDDAKAENYYQKADAYKDIVRACVNDDTLNPTMSRG